MSPNGSSRILRTTILAPLRSLLKLDYYFIVFCSYFRIQIELVGTTSIVGVFLNCNLTTFQRWCPPPPKKNMCGPKFGWIDVWELRGVLDLEFLALKSKELGLLIHVTEVHICYFQDHVLYTTTTWILVKTMGHTIKFEWKILSSIIFISLTPNTPYCHEPWMLISSTSTGKT